MNPYHEANKRKRSTIESASVQYDGDHCCWQVLVMTGSDVGHQALAPTFANEGDAQAFARELAHVFGETRLDKIVGRECWVLRPFGYNNDMIEGVEVDGRRLTLTGWARRVKPDAPSRLDRERQSVLSEIAWAERRAQQERERLATLDEDYTEWSER